MRAAKRMSIEVCAGSTLHVNQTRYSVQILTCKGANLGNCLSFAWLCNPFHLLLHSELFFT